MQGQWATLLLQPSLNPMTHFLRGESKWSESQVACLLEEGKRKGFCGDVVGVVLEQGACHEPDSVQLLIFPLNALRDALLFGKDLNASLAV